MIIYVPTRHKVLVLADEKNTEKMEEVLTVEDRFDADTVVRYVRCIQYNFIIFLACLLYCMT